MEDRSNWKVYRIHYGWGDRQQALYAMFQAPTLAHAEQMARALLERITIQRVEAASPSAVPAVWGSKYTELSGGGQVEEIDHSRWQRPQIEQGS